MNDRTSDPIEDHVRGLLRHLGEDEAREGLHRTPERVARALRFFSKGYAEDPKEIVSGALFVEDYQEMIVLRDVDFYSLCEHHLLPFFGKCHVAYLPDKKIIGLSKIPRLIEVFSRRLQVQERLTTQIARTLNDTLKPKGVGVVVEAYHLCMMMRGVEKQNTHAVTSSMIGRFRSDARTREEFMDLLRRNKSL